MVDKIIAKIAQTIDKSAQVSDETRQQLHQQLNALQSELEQLHKQQHQQAVELAELTKSFADNSLAQEKDEANIASSQSTLQKKLAYFEVTHPNLTRIINQICTTLGV